MARKKTKKVEVESLKHKDKRKDIPSEELRDFVGEDEEKPPAQGSTCRPGSGSRSTHGFNCCR